MGASRAARLRSQHFAFLVHNEDTPSSALGSFLQANSRDKCLRWVAQQAIRELLLGLEGRVGLGAVIGKTKDAEAGRSKGLVRVAEEANLGSACMRVSYGHRW